MSVASSWLDQLRLVGQHLSSPSKTARSAYAQNLLNDLIPPDPESMRRKFRLDPNLGQKANIRQIQEDFGVANVRGAISEWQFAENWARSAFAQVLVAPRLFASFAETQIPAEAIPDFGVPWDCFVVRVPDDFDSPPIDWGPGVTASIAYLTCERMQEDAPQLAGSPQRVPGGTAPRFLFSARPAGRPGAALWCNFEQPADLLGTALNDGNGVHSWDGGSWVDHEDDDDSPEHTPRQFLSPQTLAVQQLTVMRRAFVGVLMELMNAPESNGRARVNRVKRDGRNSGKPKSFTIILTRPVVVDCRERVKAKLRGERVKGTAFVQRLIRGHWKNQPCGARGSERKFIHVEPYWRGPEDAPIAVGPHMLKGGSAAE